MNEFKLDREQIVKIAAWLSEHDKTCPYTINQGAIGGRLTYSFTHTGLGNAVTVNCACGESIDVTDYDSW